MTSSITTLTEAIARFDVDVLDHLDREVTIPSVSRIGRQGDVLIVRRDKTTAATTAVPTAGYPAVRGESGGNTHLLLADGAVFYDARTPSPSSLDLGVLTITPGATGYLAHPEHGYLAITPGTYVLRRQREQADELRLVAD